MSIEPQTVADRTATEVPVTGPTLVAPSLPGDSARLRSVARTCAQLIGDASLVWARTGGPLEAAACDARDPALRRLLDRAMRAAPSQVGARWIDQVAERGGPLRVSETSWSALGVQVDGDQAISVLCLPVSSPAEMEGVVALVREPGRLPFSLRDSVTAIRAVADSQAAPGQPPPRAAAAEHHRAAYCLTDLDGTVSYVSDAATEMLGQPAGALEGQPLRQLIPDAPAILDGTFAVHAERCDRKVAGRNLWLDMTSEPLLDRAGRRQGTINSFTDISDRRAAETRTRQRIPTRLPRRGGDQPLR